MFVWPVQALTTLQQHHANLDQAALDPHITPQKASEIRGERGAAKHMSGQQDTFLCHCETVDEDELGNVRDEDDFYQMRCSECEYEAPWPDEWKMVKGWSGGGTGVDQIWIKPPDWNWLNPNHPPLEEVRIVEAKGGDANLDINGTYVGYFGTDGNPIGEEGVLQMSDDWVYITCDIEANSAQFASEHKAVATAVRDYLTGKRDDIQVTGIVIRDGKPLTDDDLPLPHQDLVDEDGIFNYEPAEDDRTQTLREQLDEVIVLLGPDTGEVADLCNQIKDHVKGSTFDEEYITKYKQSVKAVAQIFQSKNTFSPSEQVLKNHFVNVLAQIDRLIDMLPQLIDRNYLKIYPDPTSPYITKDRKKRAMAKARKDALTQLYKSLNEVAGEVDAAKLMYNRNAQMVRGWSGGDTGIDQIWVQSTSSPKFNINNSPWPQDVKILIVEAKGGSSGLSKGHVYRGVALSTGVTMVNGCQQMDSDWVLHHADDLATLAEVAPGDHALGKLIQQGITTGNPPVRGIGVKGGNAMDDDDFLHIPTPVIKGDVNGFRNVRLLKYGP